MTTPFIGKEDIAESRQVLVVVQIEIKKENPQER